MGKLWKKFTSYLRSNVYKNFKKLVERTGIWLIGMIQIGIGVLIYICSGVIVDPFFSNSAAAAIAITGESLAIGIGYMFKNGNGNQIEEPQ